MGDSFQIRRLGGMGRGYAETLKQLGSCKSHGAIGEYGPSLRHKDNENPKAPETAMTCW
jgi:hypothetical protein